jgi:hypothetical protein
MLRRRRIVTGTRGSDTRCSTVQKPSRATAPTPRPVRAIGSVHERSPAVVNPYTNARRPTVTRTAPGTSTLGREAGRLSLSTTGATANTTTATTTLRKNADRQLTRSVRSPPRIAPVVNPAAISAPFSPSARSRRGPSGKAVVSSERAAGVTIAVASPCSTRAVIRTSGVPAKPPATEEMPSRAMPSRNSRRRPKRSPIRPNNSVNPAANSANDVAIHCRFSREKPTSAPITGSATLRMEKSTAKVKLAVRSTRRTRRSRTLVGVS